MSELGPSRHHAARRFMLWLEFAPGLSTATMLARFLEREKR